jgi:hypothetical protein
MATIIANASFSYKGDVYQHGATYDTAVATVNAANTAVPHLFYASGGTKTATDTFVYKDTRAGGIERIVYIGELLPSNDNAVTVVTSGGKFK